MTSSLSLPPSEQEYMTSAGGFMKVQEQFYCWSVVLMIFIMIPITSDLTNTTNLMRCFSIIFIIIIKNITVSPWGASEVWNTFKSLQVLDGHVNWCYPMDRLKISSWVNVSHIQLICGHFLFRAVAVNPLILFVVRAVDTHTHTHTDPAKECHSE